MKLLEDGWTAVTRDRSLSAQFEHSVGITEGRLRDFHRLACRPVASALRPDLTPVPGGDDDLKAGHRERLRARLLEGGGDGFHDYELVEYLLGLAIPRRDTKPLAKLLIAEFGNLPRLLAASGEELKRVPGMTDGAAAALKFVEAAAIRSLRTRMLDQPVLSGWQALLDYLHGSMAHRVTEEFRVVFLNNRNIVIRDEAMGMGTINAASVYPREVVKRALELGASAVVLVHNHPSGDPAPSRDDIQMTKAIVEAGRPLGLSVHDHVVIGTTGHASFRALGLL